MFIQLPFFICFFWALRDMVASPEMFTMSTGGTAWFFDLSVTDPLYALPLISCAVQLVTVQVSYAGRVAT